MTDQNRKTLRSFYCRDYLWEHFEQMAQELGCSMDYLINESMRLYARNRDESPDASGVGAPAGQGASGGPAHSGAQTGGAGPRAQASGPNANDGFGNSGGNRGQEHRTFQQVPSVGKNSPSNSQSPGGGSAGPSSGAQQQSSGPGGPPPPPPRPGGGPGGGSQPGGQPSNNWQQSGPSQQPRQSGPPQPPGGNQSPGGNLGGGLGPDTGAGGGGQPPLYLSFNNNRYVIEQDKYVIGRGSKHTDLTIRDGNISRKHCAIIYRNGSYYIKDLDSTNGVEYRGNRIESKKIEEGDVFYLCDYELRFSMRG